MKGGIFITLEGGEGAGKSTQIVKLCNKLKALGYGVVATREPGGSIGAEAVRHVLLSGAAEALGAEMEAILFSAARADHIDSVIKPALGDGQIVVCDRFYDSTRVYQGVEGKLHSSFVQQLEQVAVGDAIPDLTLILDLDPKEGMKRANARRAKGVVPDRFEKESLKLQQLRREGFLKIAKNEPLRCVVVDALGTSQTVFRRLWKAVEERLGERIKIDSNQRGAPGSRVVKQSKPSKSRAKKAGQDE